MTDGDLTGEIGMVFLGSNVEALGVTYSILEDTNTNPRGLSGVGVLEREIGP